MASGSLGRRTNSSRRIRGLREGLAHLVPELRYHFSPRECHAQRDTSPLLSSTSAWSFLLNGWPDTSYARVRDAPCPTVLYSFFPSSLLSLFVSFVCATLRPWIWCSPPALRFIEWFLSFCDYWLWYDRNSFSFRLFVSCVDEILRVNSLANSFFDDCFKICFFLDSQMNIFFTSGFRYLILDYLLN